MYYCPLAILVFSNTKWRVVMYPSTIPYTFNHNPSNPIWELLTQFRILGRHNAQMNERDNATLVTLIDPRKLAVLALRTTTCDLVFFPLDSGRTDSRESTVMPPAIGLHTLPEKMERAHPTIIEIGNEKFSFELDQAGTTTLTNLDGICARIAAGEDPRINIHLVH